MGNIKPKLMSCLRVIVIPGLTRNPERKEWVPAFAGMMLHRPLIMQHSIIICFLLLTSCFSLLTSASWAEEAVITANRMEYLSESNTYSADGSVTITFGDATLTADEILMDGNTDDVVATGNVTYRDADSEITAGMMELNFKTKLGAIRDSYLYYKEHNFHLRSREISKTGEKTFFLRDATATTCDADPPEWRISSRDISVTREKSLSGWHGTFDIMNTPVLYMPYFWAPLIKDRQTGLLLPSYGYSSTRGMYYKQGFFWAIKDNQDATFYLDYYGKKGLAEGLDYRYILSPGSDGELWLYHVQDREASRRLSEIKSYHNQKFPHDITGYLKLHAVNEPDYYETMDSTSAGRFGLSSWEPARFGLASEERLQKYLESDLHLSKQYDSGRIYLLAQGRQSLEGPSKEVLQRLPETGFVLNTQSRKYISFNMAVNGVNYWREKGQDGMKFDINPNLYFSYGRLFNVTQRAGIRETAYFLNGPSRHKNRLIYDLDTTLTTKLFKKYSSLIHVIEPSLQYTYIPFVDQDKILSFDPTDHVPETSNITYALTNRVSGLGTKYLEARFRLSQSYSLLGTNDPFTPLLAEVTLSGSELDLSLNASYDANYSILTEMIGSAKLRVGKGFIAVGKNFRRSTELDQYTFEAGIYRPIKLDGRSLPIDFHGTLWYNADARNIQELNISSTYKKQCWGYSVTYIDRRDEFQIIFAVEFTGLGTFSLGNIENASLTQPGLSRSIR
ncbi:MAG: LPS-assembly protein LptD [Nitrospirae bacterium]|nr:LPS-assembly protein LptD [Nitrospirota bacterium]